MVHRQVDAAGAPVFVAVVLDGLADGRLQFSLGPLASVPIGVVLEIEGRPFFVVMGAATPVEKQDAVYKFRA